VRNSLKALDGVREVEVDLEEKLAIVVYDSNMVDTSSMIKATTEIGFPSSINPPDEQH